MTGRIRGGGNHAARNCRLGFIGGRSRSSGQCVIQSSACRRMARGCGDCGTAGTIKEAYGKTLTKTSFVIATKPAFSEIAYAGNRGRYGKWLAVQVSRLLARANRPRRPIHR
jgi:hypothetical protein